MRFSTKLIMVVMSMMLLASCGTELPDNIKNYEVNKGGDSGGTNNNNQNNNQSSSTSTGIPAESDNPLPNF